jgi:tetraacyldisaccharide 4'-kinase
MGVTYVGFIRVRSKTERPNVWSIPLVVVGALKAGGSGKTSVTLELARIFSERGLKVAILAYRLGSLPKSGDRSLQEVHPGDDWQNSSEEAVMLSRLSNCRVFVTRHRARAWLALHAQEIFKERPFDLILSDDGFQDPRLKGAFRLLLSEPSERPKVFDLLPAGPFRETWRARTRADLRLEGPLPRHSVTPVVREKEFVLEPSFPAVHFFQREILFPPGVAKHRPWIVLCGLGDNQPFLADLKRADIHPVVVVEGQNHSPPPIKRLKAWISRYPGAGILCTSKDYLKIDKEIATELPLFQVDQRIYLDPETVATVDRYRLLFGKANLVHYPK